MAHSRSVIRYYERYLAGRWHHIRLVRRFLVVWLAVIAVCGSGLVIQINTLEREGRVAVAVAGGMYSEAAVGTVTTVNPVLPDASNGDLNRLIFSGLTRYDGGGKLVGDLAERWEVSADGRTYTFYLRRGIKWHDGVAMNAEDVAFTLAAVKNPDSRSPLASSWQDITVEPKDGVVTFKLPNRLNSFLDATTLGIIPRHLLGSTDPSRLREAEFNQAPIGTGPFRIKSFATSAKEVVLEANPDYYGGRPKLDGITFRYYDSPRAALEAYHRRQVLSPGRLTLDAEPDDLDGLSIYNDSLPTETTLFFNTASGPGADAGLRRALAASVDRRAIIDKAANGEGLRVSQPLLPGQLGYTTAYASKAFTPDESLSALEAAGWKVSSDNSGGIRSKDGRELRLEIITSKSGSLPKVAAELARQWRPLGVDVKVQAVEPNDLQQTHLRPRNFDVALYGTSIGADPDVYAYWHSSQAKDPGVNLSGYGSSEADRALEGGRVATDPKVRAARYDSFLKAWNVDAPAIVLYQQAYVYAVDRSVKGPVSQRLITPSDRFAGVTTWTVEQRLVPRYP